MTPDRSMPPSTPRRASERWFRLLVHLYPVDFREEMGAALVDAQLRRAHEASVRRGAIGVFAVWLRALGDSVWNGLGERLNPAAFWRRQGNWGRDLEMARRRLWRAPLFLAATIATLSVGLGAFAVVYTAVDKVLLEPVPYRDPGDLYYVWRDYSAYGGLHRGWLTGPDVAELDKAGGVIEAVAGMQLVAPTFSLKPDGDPLPSLVMLTSPTLFELLGVQPMLGRAFAAHEVGPDRPSVVMLSHALWTRLGSNPSIIGSDVWLSGTRYTVIGVMGPGFRFVRHASLGPPQEADAYLPFRFHLADQDLNNASFAGLIRVHRGTSPEQAAAAVSAVGRFVDQRDNQRRGLRFYPVGLQADLVAPVRPILLALGAAGLFLVLVLTVNLASLLLARAAEREKEIAVSRALGANGRAVVRAMLLEGGLLGLAGGVAGAFVGMWGSRMLVALAPLDLPRRSEIALDWSVAAVVVSLAVLLGVAAAVLPAVWASRVRLASMLAASAVRGAGGSTRMRRGIIVAQVALSLVLLSAGGLVVRSFERLLSANPGFRPDGVLTFMVAMGPRLFPKTPEALAFQDRLETAVRALPGVTDVSATWALPLSASAEQGTITIPGSPGTTGDAQRDSVTVDIVLTRAGYAELMGMRLLAGRYFEERRAEGVREALIDRHLAEQFFPTGSPLGAIIPLKDQAVTVVGVIEQARLYTLHQDGRPQILVRSEDWSPYTSFFVLRTSGEPQALAGAVGPVVRKVDPRIPVSQVRTMNEIVGEALRQPRISAVLVAGFAIGAVLLVTMGLFGLVSGSVSRRRGEIAVRLALGASHQRVLGLVLREGAWLVLAGMALAVPGIYAGGGLIRGLLIGVSPWDPATLLAAALGLATIAMAACYIPARRVLGLNPSPLLRED
jgi:putative ABC transport system permease protein